MRNKPEQHPIAAMVGAAIGRLLTLVVLRLLAMPFILLGELFKIIGRAGQRRTLTAPRAEECRTFTTPSGNGFERILKEAAEPAASPQAFSKRLAEEELQKLEAPTQRYSCEALRDTYVQVTAELHAWEGFDVAPQRPETNDRIALARYRDLVERHLAKARDPKALETFTTAINLFYLTLRHHVPRSSLYKKGDHQRSPLSTPFSLHLSHDELMELWAPFKMSDAANCRLFQNLNARVQANYDTLRKERQPITFSSLFANTALTSFEGCPLPFAIPDETRFAGMWCVAPQGMGKTTALHNLIIEDANKEASVILMDSKGELIEPFLNHPAIAHRRIIIGPDNPIGMNPLDIPHTDINKAVDNLEYLFASLLDFKLTASQSMLLKVVLRSLVTAFPNPTLGTFQDILSGRHFPPKYAQYIQKLEPDLQNFFKNEFSGDNINARRQELLHRLRSLLDHDLLRSMLLAPSTTFRIGEAMDQGAFIIINNSRARLGNKGAEFFGRFFIAQVLAAAQERSFRKERDKKPCYFFIDEAHTVIAQDERITDVLHECRSQKIALVLAHQETIQVSDKVLSALENCAVRFAHPDEEARKLSGTMRMDTTALQSMLPRSQFAAYVRGLSKEGFIVNVPRPDFTRLKATARPNGQGGTVQAPPPDTTIYAGPPTQSSEEIVQDSFRRAHPHIQQVFLSDEFENYLRGLTKGFDETAHNRFENEVLLVLLGAQPVEDLLTNLQQEVPLTPEFVRKIGKELELFVKHILEQAANMPPEPPSEVLKEPIVNFNPRPPEMEPWRLDSADKKQSKEDRDDLTEWEPSDPKPEPPDGPAPKPPQKRRWDPVD